MDFQIRVLLAKIGMDGHDRGARVVASTLREAGMEVIYTGPWQTVDQVAKTAIQEDVDVIGISSLSYDHVLIPKLLENLRKYDADDKIVIVGGIIPDDDVKMLLQAGVTRVFHPGTKLDTITNFIKEAVLNRRQ